MQIPMSKLRGFISVYSSSLRQDLPSLERTRRASSSGGRGKKVVKVCLSRWQDRKRPECVSVLRHPRLFLPLAWQRFKWGCQGFSGPDSSPGLAERIGEILRNFDTRGILSLFLFKFI